MIRVSAALAAVVLLGPVPAGAQQVTQPSQNLNQSQLQTNQNQQPPNVTGATSSGQQMNQPIPTQNQSQIQSNQSQQSGQPIGNR